ncbi:MAG TPA: alpha/beta hydrolase [Allosphingosinicella sp.]|uniref:alpha/beta fold hydrolase n=1 Tax=Allosphingosinicella sp. TaxID=2823234 RepID=UPI002ED8A2B9
MRNRLILFAAAALAVLPAQIAGRQQTQAPAVKVAAPKPFSSDRISVVVQGSGRDVILIPGLTASRDMWRSTVAAVPGYRYHLVQVNGFAGHAARGNASGPVVDPVAKEIARYIAEQRLQRPALIGHSMGGTLAMMVAARQPQAVGKVMVVDMLPRPAGMFGGGLSLFGGIAERLAATPEGRRALGNLIGRFGADDPHKISDSDVVARATHDLGRTDLTAELPRIIAPMTVLFATPGADTREHALAVEDYRHGYSGARTARLRPIPRSGHMIIYDQPARFRAEVKQFLGG